MIERDLEQFPDNRHEGEYVLRQSQLVMLRILKIVDYICRKHNIEYWLDAGTLLGAVRHGGFIPWDDDVDIVMHRDDYNRFIEIGKEELPKDLFFQYYKTDLYYDMPWIKIRDRNSMIVEYKPGKYHRGMFIDIFPVDDFSGDYDEYVKIKRNFKNIYRTMTLINEPFEKVTNTKTLTRNFAKLGLKVLGFPITLMGRERVFKYLFNKRDNILSRFSHKGGNLLVYSPDALFWNFKVPKDVVYPLTTIKFEDGEFFAPGNYDEYLKIMFGDYMQLPPEEDRVSHNLGLKPILSEEEKASLNEGF
ncbi:LicD family protein [Fonticella tunisiensis]|uniref:Lipopolysaccharide cholinephosphotransferase n=1 Tax=Fonticella tunisiensis TaxID=1096341 RepID=A0A4R7KAN7_9CLOT|nr:LicD family protein [Fonticella tunisiensis]TDT50825.1 lipopolysaccharide cholinephosphotransferase [Fonticella tunisiensis]